MYINNKKRKLDSRDLDTVANAEYFTCIYYKPKGQSKRTEFKTYKEAYKFAYILADTVCNPKTTTDCGYKIWDKRKIMFYAVKGTSQCHIGGLK